VVVGKHEFHGLKALVGGGGEPVQEGLVQEQEAQIGGKTRHGVLRPSIPVNPAA